MFALLMLGFWLVLSFGASYLPMYLAAVLVLAVGFGLHLLFTPRR
ncbi:MAG TPA: hypothetical protein PKD73_06085 [Burkholderiaceae bacterium]|nr:hypothetical protein [Burkholderiaceae bacterium]